MEESPEDEELTGRACGRLRIHGFGCVTASGLSVGCMGLRRCASHVEPPGRGGACTAKPTGGPRGAEGFGPVRRRLGDSEELRFGAALSCRAAGASVRSLIWRSMRRRFRVKAPCFGRAHEPGARGVAVRVSARYQGVSRRFNPASFNRQEGNGAGDGVRLCEGRKALKGATP
jgi:hypothetical protein